MGVWPNALSADEDIQGASMSDAARHDHARSPSLARSPVDRFPFGSVCALALGRLLTSQHRGEPGAVVWREFQQRRRQRFERRIVTAFGGFGTSSGASARLGVRIRSICNTLQPGAR